MIFKIEDEKKKTIFNVLQLNCENLEDINVYCPFMYFSYNGKDDLMVS